MAVAASMRSRPSYSWTVCDKKEEREQEGHRSMSRFTKCVVWMLLMARRRSVLMG